MSLLRFKTWSEETFGIRLMIFVYQILKLMCSCHYDDGVKNSFKLKHVQEILILILRKMTRIAYLHCLACLNSLNSSSILWCLVVDLFFDRITLQFRKLQKRGTWMKSFKLFPIGIISLKTFYYLFYFLYHSWWQNLIDQDFIVSKCCITITWNSFNQ